MNHLDERDEPITEAELDLPDVKTALDNLQGHILRSHGRDHSVHIFLRFLPEQEEAAKNWIERIARERITSAQKQLEQSKDYHINNNSGHLFCSFFLSARGYHALGIPMPGDEAFQDGMSARQQSAWGFPALNDPPRQEWEPQYQDEIHAMLLLACDDEDVLRAAVQVCETEVQEFAQICATEQGRVRRDARKQSIEHFGYVDGRSQPLFFKKGESGGGGDKDGPDYWCPEAGPSLVLVKDPYGDPCNQGIKTYGSYLVFRKLEQDVDGFRKALEDVASALQLQGHDRQRAEALVMGRFRDGTPLVLQATPGMHDPIPDTFTFVNDPQGLKCPFQAHIRKMNPRGERDRNITNAIAAAFYSLSLRGGEGNDHIRDGLTTTLANLLGEGQPEYNRIRPALDEALQELAPGGQARYERLAADLASFYDERCHRIARRSIVYGIRKEEQECDPSLMPTPTVGVLFMCYQKNISQQFEYLQANWANREDFPDQKLKPGPDAIVGHGETGQNAYTQKWPRRWGSPRKEHEDFCLPRFVTLRGGEYFFAPSISFLRDISKVAPSTTST